MSAAQVTEAHRDLTLRVRVCDMHYGIEPAAQLIADSEARAVGLALTGITCTHHTDEERRECPVRLVTKLRAEVERLQKDRDSWKAKHWKAHDDFQLLFETCKELQDRAERAEAKVSNQAERIRYLEGATNHATGTPLSLAVKRAERAEAELAKERERLDWLEFRGPWEAWSEPCEDAEITLRGPIRAAIDAAMKEEGK